MNKIYHLANVSIARGCGFAMLAIATFMLGLSGNFPVALRAGGYMALGMCLVLVLMAVRAKFTPYKRTELWLLLQPSERPQAEVAQTVISSARREACLVFALRSAWLSAVLLTLAVVWTQSAGVTLS